MIAKIKLNIVWRHIEISLKHSSFIIVSNQNLFTVLIKK